MIDFIICYILAYPELYFLAETKLIRCADILQNKELQSINKYFEVDGSLEIINFHLWLNKNTYDFNFEKIEKILGLSNEIANKNGVFTNSDIDFIHLVAELEETANKSQLKKHLISQLKEIENVNTSVIVENLTEIAQDYINTDKPIQTYKQKAPSIINALQTSKMLVKFKRYQTINKATESLSLGEYIIVIGYAKSGKTTILYNLILDYVLQGLPVCSCQLELTEEMAYSNIFAITNGIKYSDFRSGNFNAENLKIHDFPLYLEDERNIDLILTKFRELKKRHNVNIFFIDQLSHIQTTKNFDTLTNKYIEISQRLEKFAKKEKVLIFLAVQDGRGGKGDMKSDAVSWSDGVIKDADTVFKINKLMNLEEKVIKSELPNFLLPDNREFLSVLSITESRHTHYRGIISVIQTFADKSMKEIYSPLGAIINNTLIEKPTI